MSVWNCYRIYHSRRNAIDIYCKQLKGGVEICITNADENNLKILIHDLLYGQVNNLFLDQNSSQINWVKKRFSFNKSMCEFDMAEVRKKQGQLGEVDFLVYHIANSINQTYTNKTFSRYLKQHIIGKWTYGDFSISFNENFEYESSNNSYVVTPFRGLADNGKYNLFRNMLYFQWTGFRGLRIQIINLSDDRLLFGGLYGALYFVLKKEQNTTPNNGIAKSAADITQHQQL